VLCVVDLHFKKGVWLFVHDDTRQLDQFFFHLNTFV
jgi:hypothetical protein